MVAKVSMEELMALMNQGGEERLEGAGINEATVFVSSVVSELSGLTLEAAKKEAPAIVQKKVHGMSVDRIKQIADKCKGSIGHPPGTGCVKCDIYNVVAEALASTASLNLS
jgi:hypothetical protein